MTAKELGEMLISLREASITRVSVDREEFDCAGIEVLDTEDGPVVNILSEPRNKET